MPGIPKLHQGRIPACEMTAVSYIDVGMVCSTASFEEHNLMAWNNLPYLPVYLIYRCDSKTKKGLNAPLFTFSSTNLILN